MRYEEIRVGQRVYDPKIQAHYVWVAGQFVTPEGFKLDNICTACGFPDKYFLKWSNNNPNDRNTYFCTECADIEPLQVVMVAVK